MRDKLGRFQKGYHPKNEFKKGVHPSPETEFKKGHHRSPEIIEKRKKTIAGQIAKGIKKAPLGENSPNWKGGIQSHRSKIQSSIEYKEWRKAVFEKDEYTCVICGKVGGKINAHHIKSFRYFPELRFDINNGITLCSRCHYIGKKEIPLFFLRRR